MSLKLHSDILNAFVDLVVVPQAVVVAQVSNIDFVVLSVDSNITLLLSVVQLSLYSFTMDVYRSRV